MKIEIAIKKIRKDLGISQKDFAETLGISQIYLSQIEHGQKSPNFKNVIERVSVNQYRTVNPTMFILNVGTGMDTV